MCVSPSPMLIWVLQWSQCLKIRVAQHWGGRGHITVRTKVWGVNLKNFLKNSRETLSVSMICDGYYNPHKKSWNTCVRFPFTNVDLGITVVSVLQNTRGSTLGRERAHYSSNKSVRSKSQVFSRKFKRNTFCFNDLWRVLFSLIRSRFCLITQRSSPTNGRTHSNHIPFPIWANHSYGSIFWNCFAPNNLFRCCPIIACVL